MTSSKIYHIDILACNLIFPKYKFLRYNNAFQYLSVPPAKMNIWKFKHILYIIPKDYPVKFHEILTKSVV